jgi:hypothetical protein
LVIIRCFFLFFPFLVQICRYAGCHGSDGVVGFTTIPRILQAAGIKMPHARHARLWLHGAKRGITLARSSLLETRAIVTARCSAEGSRIQIPDEILLDWSLIFIWFYGYIYGSVVQCALFIYVDLLC